MAGSDLLDARILKEVYRLGGSVSNEDAVALIRYFTDLADFVDNELFSEMLRFGIQNQQFSPMARDKYDDGLKQRLEDQTASLRGKPFDATLREVANRVRSTIDWLQESAKSFTEGHGLEYLLAVKPTTQELVGQLLLAAEFVGGTTGKTR